MKKSMLLVLFAMMLIANSWSATTTEETTVTKTKKVTTSDPSPKATPYPFWVEVVGQNPMTIVKGSTFADSGAIAHGPRKVDGPIKMFSTDKVDTNVVGSVTLVYSRVTRLQKMIKATRVVMIVDNTKPNPSPSPTATKVVVSKKERKFADRWFQWEYQLGLAAFNTQSEMPQGFSNRVSSNVGQNFSMEFIVAKKIGLKMGHDSGHLDLETKVYGSSIGNIRISNGWEFLVKVYPVRDDRWLPYVGIGAKFADITQGLMIGGTPFDHKDTNRSALFEVGAVFPVTNFIGASVSGQMFKLGRVTSIPYTVDVSQFETFAVKAGLVLRP